MSSILEDNIRILASRFPKVAESVMSLNGKAISVMSAKDGGSFFAVQSSDGNWQPVSNPENPMECAQKSLDLMMHRILYGLSPAVVVGLAPGYVLETIFNHFESRIKHSEPFRHIYVIINSPECLVCWLSAADRSKILKQPEVEFYLVSDIQKIVELCDSDFNRSHLFLPVSELPEEIASCIINPLAELYMKRERETETWHRENCDYYDSIGNAELAKIIQGRAGRKPRLMMPTHASSTVVQYSARDTCEVFDKLGWETKILKIERDLPPWLLTKTIHEFKPDLFLFINHLRTEDENVELYPGNMLFVTWIQDSMPSINNQNSAARWNEAASKRKRDIIIGYVEQLKQYGYNESRLFNCGMIVNTRIFHPIRLSKEELEKYSCDLCFASNRSQTSQWSLENNLQPTLSKLGFSTECLWQLHELLWADYRAGKSFTDYESLQQRLLMHSSFKEIFDTLSMQDQDGSVQRIFWHLNDIIYRHLTLEWLDQYSKLHPSFKFHIYGKGWDTHPCFSKYAKGTLEHGPELNLAYNAAKACLHLNSMEGAHQRTSEILAAGSRLLTRISRKLPIPNSKTLGKEFDALILNVVNAGSDFLQAIDPARIEDAHSRELVSDWIFQIAYGNATQFFENEHEASKFLRPDLVSQDGELAEIQRLSENLVKMISKDVFYRLGQAASQDNSLNFSDASSLGFILDSLNAENRELASEISQRSIQLNEYVPLIKPILELLEVEQETIPFSPMFKGIVSDAWNLAKGFTAFKKDAGKTSEFAFTPLLQNIPARTDFVIENINDFLLKYAEAALQDGNIPSAREALLGISIESAGSPLFLCKLSAAFTQTGLFEKAHEAYSRAESNGGQKFDEFHFCKINYLLSVGRIQEALAFVESVILSRGSSVRLNRVRGFILFMLGKFEEALHYVSELDFSTDKRECARCLFLLGDIHRSMNDYDDAIFYYKQAERAGFKGWELAFSHASLLWYLQRRPEAFSIAEKSRLAYPQDKNLCNILSFLLGSHDYDKEACMESFLCVCQRAYDSTHYPWLPYKPWAGLQLMLANFKCGHIPKARELFSAMSDEFKSLGLSQCHPFLPADSSWPEAKLFLKVFAKGLFPNHPKDSYERLALENNQLHLLTNTQVKSNLNLKRKDCQK